MRERAGGEQVHQPIERVARLLGVERHPEALALAAPPREEVAGVGDAGWETGAREQRLEGEGVEGELDPAPAVEAPRLRKAERGAGLVVPDVEGAVRALVDPIDRAAEQERAAASGVDRHGLAARDRPAPIGAGQTERHLEEARRDVAAVLLLELEKRPASEQELLAPLGKGDLAARRDP